MRRQALFLYVFLGIALSFFGYWIFLGVFGQSNQKEVSKQITKSDFKSSIDNTFDEYKFFLDNKNFGNQSEVFNSQETDYTKNIAIDISNQFISKIESGANTSTIKDIGLNPDMIDQMMAEVEKSLNNLPSVSELNVIDDNSVSAAKKYLSDTLSLINSAFKDLPNDFVDQSIVAFFDRNDPSILNKVILYNKKLISDLKSLPVPKQYVDLHRRMIGQFNASSFLYSVLLNFKDDPFKLMAVEKYLDTMNARSSSIINELKKENLRLSKLN
jgi:hypothetical protein